MFIMFNPSRRTLKPAPHESPSRQTLKLYPHETSPSTTLNTLIIIVESVGTFCELGAFSFSKDLVDKLYIINDEQHREDKSFINRGPIRKINDSRSGETKYIT